MRIERLKIGTRIRVILSRRDVAAAAKTFLPASAELRKAVSSAAMQRRLELACRVVVASCLEKSADPLVVPRGAAFSVGLSTAGDVSGATFEWFSQED